VRFGREGYVAKQAPKSRGTPNLIKNNYSPDEEYLFVNHSDATFNLTFARK
jgi:hypothetical protein